MVFLIFWKIQLVKYWGSFWYFLLSKCTRWIIIYYSNDCVWHFPNHHNLCPSKKIIFIEGPHHSSWQFVTYICIYKIRNKYIIISCHIVETTFFLNGTFYYFSCHIHFCTIVCMCIHPLSFFYGSVIVLYRVRNIYISFQNVLAVTSRQV